MAFGEDFTMTPTSESGSSLKRMATVFIHGRMEIVMKVNGTCASNMEQEQIFSLTGTPIQESIKMVNHMVKANIPGLTEQFT
jgi:hypothetical protein